MICFTVPNSKGEPIGWSQPRVYERFECGPFSFLRSCGDQTTTIVQLFRFLVLLRPSGSVMGEAIM